ncbi:uncharacterized protein LOC110027288 isoform X3 [Phalaenopsis equestris]|uniref:uncharacterized protein LOC110027288 isoform X3 n=1 Tax=Phalaenopsis equestris TaxID=78828 RepID=UPI0009E4B694|nr:uncharacterized protein LOC110027288 isoform X3 [Phalaenopsis equestris]
MLQNFNKMRRSATSLFRSLGSRKFSSTAASASHDQIVAAVLFERLPVVIPKIDPIVYAFQEFSLRWGQQYRRKYPDEVLGKGEARGKGDYHIDYVPAPRITEADKINDQNTFGAPSKKPVWHFPEKVYENEDTMRLCAESALKSILGGLDHTYFVGNAPFAHMTIGPTENSPDSPMLQEIFFQISSYWSHKITSWEV